MAKENKISGNLIFLTSLVITIVWCALFMSLTNLNGMTHLNFILNSIGLFIVPAIFICFIEAEIYGEGALPVVGVLILLFAISVYNLMDCAGIIKWLNS